MDAFAALADPNRRAMVELVAQRGELAASEIAAHFAISAPAVSQHLKVLREAGVLRVEKRAQQRIYRVNPDAMQTVAGWAQRMAGVWRQRFDALDALLQAEQQAAQLPSVERAEKAGQAKPTGPPEELQELQELEERDKGEAWKPKATPTN